MLKMRPEEVHSGRPSRRGRTVLSYNEDINDDEEENERIFTAPKGEIKARQNSGQYSLYLVRIPL